MEFAENCVFWWIIHSLGMLAQLQMANNTSGRWLGCYPSKAPPELAGGAGDVWGWGSPSPGNSTDRWAGGQMWAHVIHCLAWGDGPNRGCACAPWAKLKSFVTSTLNLLQAAADPHFCLWLWAALLPPPPNFYFVFILFILSYFSFYSFFISSWKKCNCVNSSWLKISLWAKPWGGLYGFDQE